MFLFFFFFWNMSHLKLSTGISLVHLNEQLYSFDNDFIVCFQSVVSVD